MKPFLCNCGNTLYFDNTFCLECKKDVGYDSVADKMVYDGPNEAHARCANGVNYNACNWTVPVADAGKLCPACELSRVVPNLSDPKALFLWKVMEQAKRNVVYSLLRLELPLVDRVKNPVSGLTFEFMLPQPGVPVVTGHEKGVIAINLEEADDALREKNRSNLHEPYRTLHGHFRHELGHYYWYYWFEMNQTKPGMLDACRDVFGDERPSYEEAMKIHYANGAPSGWEQSFISSYSTMHPYEDWAETWAHYLHICDGLETAEAFGLEQGVKKTHIDLFSAESAKLPAPLEKLDPGPFLNLLHRWVRLSPALNALSQSLGHRNMYPFVLSTPVVRKLHFIHACIENPPLAAREGDKTPVEPRLNQWLKSLFRMKAA